MTERLIFNVPCILRTHGTEGADCVVANTYPGSRVGLLQQRDPCGNSSQHSRNLDAPGLEEGYLSYNSKNVTNDLTPDGKSPAQNTSNMNTQDNGFPPKISNTQ